VKILIAGSRGFLGGSFGRFAVSRGAEVLGLGRASQPAKTWPGAYEHADVASSDLSGVIRNFAPDLLFHAAGTASVQTSIAEPLDDLRASVWTWANMLEGVRRSGLRPLILFPSSAAVYGDLTALPGRETSPVQPISPYGFHKAACEMLAREYAQCFGARIIVCRLFSVFGPAQRRLLIWELYQQLMGPVTTVWLKGTGNETRDYLSIEDVNSAFWHLVDAHVSGTDAPSCRVVNVASGEETNVLELAEQIRNVTAPEKQIRCRGITSPGDPQHWRADISLLRSLAPKWKPRPLSESLSACINVWDQERQ
jgi:UDP-glucose 4-epimerase